MTCISNIGWRGVAAAILLGWQAAALAAAPAIPLETGLRLVSVLHYADGDRENVVTIERADSKSVVYAWHAAARSGGSRTEAGFRREVRREDLAAAARLHTVFRGGDQADYPGYTAFTVSTAIYQQLAEAGTAPFTLATLDESARGGAAAGFGALQSPVKFKGTLTRIAREDFPLIVDGQRVQVPSIHAKGRFAYQDREVDRDFWLLADAAHPLILRSTAGGEVLQMIRIERPGAGTTDTLETSLLKECRADLPGVYFAFGSAALEADSVPALDAAAQMLARHRDWALVIEGHTDNIGGSAANQRLSEARADAVRERLFAEVTGTLHVTARGFGATRPREGNETLEGRARNRRVEITRDCHSN